MLVSFHILLLVRVFGSRMPPLVESLIIQKVQFFHNHKQEHTKVFFMYSIIGIRKQSELRYSTSELHGITDLIKHKCCVSIRSILRRIKNIISSYHFTVGKLAYTSLLLSLSSLISTAQLFTPDRGFTYRDCKKSAMKVNKVNSG